MNNWIATISDRFPEHWQIAQDNGFWDTQARRDPLITAGDLVFFVSGGSHGQVLGLVRVTGDQTPIVDGARPWSSEDDRDYRWRFTFDVLAAESLLPIPRSEVIRNVALDGANQMAVRRILNDDDARRLRLRVDGLELAMTDTVESTVESMEQQLDGVDTTKDTRVRTLVGIRLRQGQQAFRGNLLRAYTERCAVTGTAITSLLEAAHIVSYLGPHTNRTDNGLLLRADIHTLFDLSLLTVLANDLVVRCSPELQGSEYEGLDGRAVTPPANPHERPHADHLLQHNRACRAWLATAP